MTKCLDFSLLADVEKKLLRSANVRLTDAGIAGRRGPRFRDWWEMGGIQEGGNRGDEENIKDGR